MSISRTIRKTSGGLFFTLFKKTFKVEGLEFFIPFKLTDLQFRSRFLSDSYEAEERKYLKEYLPEDATVLELGSCLGIVSCLTNRLLKNKSNHVVMEANPLLIDSIRKNRDHNNCLFDIESGMISHSKENEFYIHDLIVGGSSKRKTGRKIIVNGMTIQDLEDKYNLKFDTLVMDIEGGELDLLENHPAFFHNFKMIFMEVHPFADILTPLEAKRCEEILTRLNFKLKLRDRNFQVWIK